MTLTNPRVLWDEPELAPPEWITQLEESCNVTALPKLAAADLRLQLVRTQPDVFLLMLQTLARLGLPTIRTWHAELPDMGVVVLAQRRTEDDALVRDAVAHGADGFVFSEDSAWEMEHRVMTVVHLKHARSISGVRRVLDVAPVEPPIKTTKLAQLHDPDSGRVSAKLVADYLGVNLKELCRGLGLGRSYAGVHKNPAGAALQKPLHPVIQALEYLRVLLPSETDLRVWLNTPHADLDGHTPLAVILDGKGQVVCDMLESAINGYPS